MGYFLAVLFSMLHLSKVEKLFYIYCSHVARIDLLLPLTEAKLVLGFSRPFLMQFFPGH